MRLIASILALAILAGCGNRTEIASIEQSALSQTGGDFSRNYYDFLDVQSLLNGAGEVGEAYLRLSDSVATQQDAAALLLLLTAAGGSYAAVTEQSARQLARFGLFGLTLNEGANYLRPEENSRALLNAAERQMCLVGAGRRFVGDARQTRTTRAFGLLADAFTRARIQLREELSRGNLPDYAALAQSYADALRREQEAGDRSLLSTGVRSVDPNTQLETAISACFVAA